MFKTTNFSHAVYQAIQNDVGTKSSIDSLLAAAFKYYKCKARIRVCDCSLSVVGNLKKYPHLNYVFTNDGTRYNYNDLKAKVGQARSYFRKVNNIVEDCRTYEGQPHRDQRPGIVRMGLC